MKQFSARWWIVGGLLGFVFLIPLWLHAGPVTVPDAPTEGPDDHTLNALQAGRPAKAAEVMHNFKVLAEAINELAETIHVQGGNIGIGTPNPTSTFFTSSPTLLDIASDGVPALILHSSGADWGIGVDFASGSLKFAEEVSNKQHMVLTTAGNAGIGTTAFGTSASKVLGLAVGTAPNTSPADMVQLFAESVIGGDVCVGGTPIESGHYAGYVAADAFNDDTSDFWFETSSSGWLGYDFGSGVARIVVRYRIGVLSWRGPRAWTFEGSNNRSTWTVLDTRTGAGNWGTTYSEQSFDVGTNNTPYRFYRLNMTEAIVGESELEVGEFEMYEEPGAELRVRDEAGNVTTLSPHNFASIPPGRLAELREESDGLAWTHHSERGERSITVDMFGAVKAVEDLTGRTFIYRKIPAQEAPRAMPAEQPGEIDGLRVQLAALMDTVRQQQAQIDAQSAQIDALRAEATTR